MPGHIAQLIIPSDAIGNPVSAASPGAAVDWDNQLLYLANGNGLRCFSTVFQTQNPIVSSFFGHSALAVGGIIVSDGYLLLENLFDNHLQFGVIKKYDQALNVVGSWGGAAYPNGLVETVNVPGQAFAAINVGGVPYVLCQEIALSTKGGIFRSDTMQAAGWYDTVRSNTSFHAYVTGGKSGELDGSFYTVDSLISNATPTHICVYQILVSAGAASWVPSDWPTPNPDITSSLLRTLVPTDADPSWTTIVSWSIGYDAFNDLAIVLVGQYISRDDMRFIAIAPDGTIAWVANAEPTSSPDLSQMRVNKGQVFSLSNGSITPPFLCQMSIRNGSDGSTYVPDSSATKCGAVYHGDMTDDVSQTTVTYFNYEGPGDLLPVSGTSSSYSGWSLLQLWPPTLPSIMATADVGTLTTQIINSPNLRMGDLQCVVPPPVTQGVVTLRWSDDGGQSWNNGIERLLGPGYLVNLQWRRTGLARNRIFEISWSSPGPEALIGLYVQSEPSAS